jgi:hypothetical protein
MTMKLSRMALLALGLLGACSGDGAEAPQPSGDQGTDIVHLGGGPAAGLEGSSCQVGSEAGLEDSSTPTRVVGDGTPQSCTSAAVVAAVAEGGVITFDCGPEPVVITLEQTAKVFNDASEQVVIDGGGKVTLSGGGSRRILYMNTCDEAQHWTTPHCDDQATPRLTVQNLTFADGNASGEEDGGGAIFARGGRLKIVNCRFFGNVCASTGPDVGGGAVRAFDQYGDQPIHVVHSTFGGASDRGNVGSNGGALSSIGVSWAVINSLLSYNRAIGDGGNPAQQGTPGGGSGGAIYNDGNSMTLRLCGSRLEHNRVNAYGSAIFFVSNDHTGRILIDQSVIANNLGGSWYPTHPQISNHADTPILVTDSTIAESL